jgi:hypothetical protein
MKTQKKIFSVFFISCVLCIITNAEEPKKDPNQDTVLTYETKIYGIPFQDMIPFRSPVLQESLRSEMGRNAHRAKDSRIFHITKNYFLWWSYNIAIQKTDTFLYDAMENYSTPEHNQTEILKYHICEGTALLCNNIELRNHILTGQPEWRSAVLLGSSNVSDCEKLRKYMRECDGKMITDNK